MKAPIRSWRQAQQVKSEHDLHENVLPPTSYIQSWLEGQFGLSVESLYDKQVPEVGCGTGMLHSFDFPDLTVETETVEHRDLGGFKREVATHVFDIQKFCLWARS